MSPITPKDQAVRERIIRDFATCFAVEAGAGTGKTRLLTDRIIEAIRTGHATLAQIVAITFTERAANELKVRLRTALEAGLQDARADEAERLRSALAGLDSAHTSTIHSFCAEILRERPVEAGIDPGFSVADTLESNLLFEKAWERWLADELKDENGPLRIVLLAGLTLEHVRGHANFMRANPDLRVAGEAVDLDAEMAAFAPEFARRMREMRKRMSACPSPQCTCHKRMQECARLAEQMDAAEPSTRAAFVPAVTNLEVKSAKNACKEHKDACKVMLDEAEAFIAPVRARSGHGIVQIVAGLLGRMIDDYIAEKRRAALLDFDDLLLHARNLLRSNREVREYFQSKYRMILVDEFQDTDPLQTEIVFFLGEAGAKADDWRDVRLEPGRLVFVGDPKQSIYRFRRADIETYEDAKRILLRSGEVQYISQNFRSGEPCIRWVNAVFGELIRKPDDGAYQPNYVPLEASREGDGPGVAILEPPANFKAENVGEARTAEASAVCAEILRTVETRRVFDKPTGAWRPATFGDVAILFRTRTSFGIYENALGAFGIPFRAVSGKDFFGRQEVAELRRVLKAVERPFDGLAVVAALRTSMLGVSDDELLAAKVTRFNYLAPVSDEAAAVRPVFERLAAWHARRAERSISSLVQDVLSETKALELFYLKPGGEQRAANLAKVIDLARSYEQTGGATFGGFVAWLDELRTAGDEAESPLTEEGGDFVKLITMHKAKGLEFPVVILADPAGGGQTGQAGPVVDRHEGTFDVQLGGKDLNLRTLGYAAALEREKSRAEAELKRLFYVGATRARDRLIVPEFEAETSKGGYLAFLAELSAKAAATAGACAEEIVAAESDLAMPDYEGLRIAAKDARRGECDAAVAARTKWQEERAAQIAAASEGKRIAAASGLEDAFVTAGATPASTEAKNIGTAVHAALEQVDLATGAGLAEIARREAAKHGVDTATVERLARTALSLPLVKRAAAVRHERELPFSLRAGEALLEGIIDVAFDDGKGLVILDYKTDDVGESGVAARAEVYRLQIGAYALAAREVFGSAPAAAYLLFLRPGREVEVRIDAALFEDVAKRLQRIGKE